MARLISAQKLLALLGALPRLSDRSSACEAVFGCRRKQQLCAPVGTYTSCFDAAGNKWIISSLFGFLGQSQQLYRGPWTGADSVQRRPQAEGARRKLLGLPRRAVCVSSSLLLCCNGGGLHLGITSCLS